MRQVISTARFSYFPSIHKFIFDDELHFPDGEINQYTGCFCDWIKSSLRAGSLRFYEEVDGTGFEFFILSIDEDLYRGVIQVSISKEAMPGSKNLKNSDSCPDEGNPSEKAKRGKRVLLVEDNEINKKVVESILSNLDLLLDHAWNGEEAIEKVASNDYDLILMDISMPVMDGYEATRRIRDTFPEPKSRTPVIALTAALRSESEARVAESGMNGYIGKPIVSKELIAAVQSFLFEEPRFEFINNGSGDDDIFIVDELVDLTYLKEVSNNDILFASDIVKSFLENSGPLLRELESSLGNDDIKRARELCHKFQPVLSYMGLKKIIPLMEKFHLNLQKPDINKHGQSLILEKIIKMTTEATSSLENIRKKMLERV
ncbi:MAG: response regulator [Ignavibacteria bacterium]|nr:response regulator [Ignavibacteria bacterium]